MSNFQTTVSIEDIYGKEWWERNKAELDREWEWEFGVTKPGDQVVNICMKAIPSKEYATAIILHRRKPQPPTLRGIYGVDEVTIPTGWEWTGEFRGPKLQDVYASIPGKFTSLERCRIDNPNYYPRLILRKRQPKVWFKAESRARIPNIGEWFWFGSCMGWVQSVGSYGDGKTPYLCATRHEEPDNTVQTVTQADIDRLQKVNS